MNYNFLVPTKFTACDKRMTYLVEALSLRDSVFEFESAEDMPKVEKPILVLPFFIDDTSAASFLSALEEGSLAFGGREGEKSREVINSRSIRYKNVLNDELFCRENAYITAEGALALIINSTETTLNSMRVAVLGYGRIGERLVRMLLAMGASVKVFTASEDEIALARSRGISVSHLFSREKMEDFGAVVNTVPLRHVVDAEMLSSLSGGVYVLDLASGENNVDWKSALQLSRRAEKKSSLPAKVSPRSASQALKNAIFRHLD